MMNLCNIRPVQAFPAHPMRPACGSGNTNFADANAGTQLTPLPGGSPFKRVDQLKGYGVDLNGDGRFDKSKDGILAFDINRDGRVDKNEIAESNRRLKILSGQGIARAGEYQKLKSQYDRNGNGRLDGFELKGNGAQMLTDRNGDGQFSADEAQGLRGIRSGSGKFNLHGVDLADRSSDVSRSRRHRRGKGCHTGGWGWAAGRPACWG